MRFVATNTCYLRYTWEKYHKNILQVKEIYWTWKYSVSESCFKTNLECENKCEVVAPLTTACYMEIGNILHITLERGGQILPKESSMALL